MLRVSVKLWILEGGGYFNREILSAMPGKKQTEISFTLKKYLENFIN